MTKPVTRERAQLLLNMADAFERHLANGPPRPDDITMYYIKSCERHVRYLLDHLAVERGARYSLNGNTKTLTLFGVRSSATSGATALLRNWANAARRTAERVDA